MEERKSDKKKRGIIVAAILILLLAILALCGTTFARYITQTSKPTQQATVAKWGFVVNANTDNLFGKMYNDKTVLEKEDDTTKADVKISAGADAEAQLVAPGTKGEMTFGIEGSAEVLAKIIAAMDKAKISEVSLKDNTAGATLNTNPYAPIVWQLYTGTKADGDTTVTYNSTAEAGVSTLAQVADTINANDGIVKEAGEKVAIYYKLAWEWKIETGADDDEKAANNVYDTILGYAAQGAGTYGQYTVTAIDAKAGTYSVVDNNNTTDNTDDVTYTATIKVAFDLKWGVQQIQNSERA